MCFPLSSWRLPALSSSLSPSCWPGFPPLSGLPAVHFKQSSGPPLGQLNDYPQVLIHPWHCWVLPPQPWVMGWDQSSSALVGALEMGLSPAFSSSLPYPTTLSPNQNTEPGMWRNHKLQLQLFFLIWTA